MRLMVLAVCATGAFVLAPAGHALARTSDPAAPGIHARATVAASGGVDAALARLARAASAHPQPFPNPDQFVTLRATTTFGIVFARYPGSVTTPLPKQYPAVAQAIVTCRNESWMSPGRRGALRAGPTTVRFASATGRGAWERAGRPGLSSNCPRSGSLRAVGGYPVGTATLTPAALAKVTANRRVFARYYFTHNGAPADVFALLGEQLGAISFPPRLRLEVIRSMADFPGVRVVRAGAGTIAFQIGRTGASSTELVFDGATGALVSIVRTARFGDAFAHGRSIRIRATTRYASRTVTDTAPGGP